MVGKMKSTKDSAVGARIASVHNGSSLFTGDAGSGESNIRRHIIENDLLDTIIQLPNNLFYNTGITTYIWLLSNKKAKGREGKVQLIDASQLYEKLRKNLGEKNCAFTHAHIEQITRAYLDLTDTGKQDIDGLKSQVFDNRDFGYWKITIERPLRKSAQFTADRIESLRFDKRLAEEMQWMFQQWGEKVYEKGFLTAKQQKDALEDWLEKEEIDRKSADKKKLLDPKFWLAKRELLEIAKALHQYYGDVEWNDFGALTKEVKAVFDSKRLVLDNKPSATQLKQVLDAVSWRDPEAAPVKAQLSVFDYGQYGSGYEIDPIKAARDGHFQVDEGFWSYESDSELRDTENVPMNYLGGLASEASAKEAIDAYFQSEVHPHVEDAWVDHSKTVIGYEISFNKYFYVHQPLRDLDEVVQEIRELEKETEGLLEQILSFAD